MNSLVSAERRRVHVGAEALALAVVVPLLWNIASAPRLTDSHRAFLRLLAMATLLVDGWLLWQWKRRPPLPQHTLQEGERESVSPGV